jgi:hypothetical protein
MAVRDLHRISADRRARSQALSCKPGRPSAHPVTTHASRTKEPLNGLFSVWREFVASHATQRYRSEGRPLRQPSVEFRI